MCRCACPSPTWLRLLSFVLSLSLLATRMPDPDPSEEAEKISNLSLYCLASRLCLCLSSGKTTMERGNRGKDDAKPKFSPTGGQKGPHLCVFRGGGEEYSHLPNAPSEREPAKISIALAGFWAKNTYAENSEQWQSSSTSLINSLNLFHCVLFRRCG